jgi:prefoldin subunit 5
MISPKLKQIARLVNVFENQPIEKIDAEIERLVQLREDTNVTLSALRSIRTDMKKQKPELPANHFAYREVGEIVSGVKVLQ